MGNVLKQTGTGTNRVTPDRAFAYDAVGRMTSASAPGGENTFTYDDRGNLLTTQGPSGNTTFTWGDEGQLLSATTAAGKAEYGYDSSGRLKTAQDPVTGSTATYTYGASTGRVDAIGYGGAARSFGYDQFGRLATDTVKKPDGTTSASLTYGYDKADRLTSKQTTGVAGAGTHAYTYDKAGRLASWNNGSSTTGYTWDDAGNLTQRGSTSQTFNERNQLVSSGSSTYTFTSRGTLASGTTGGVTTTADYNAFDELVAQGAAEYTYDSLNRLVSHDGNALTYVGLGRKVASASGWSYSYTPDGDVLGAGDGTTTGLGWTDQHTDLIGVINASTGVLGASRSFDPFGMHTGTSGSQPSVGYQHQYTDPTHGGVNMGSRWYSPSAAIFASRDTAALDPRDVGNANRFGYAASSPLNYTDWNGTCSGLWVIICEIVGQIIFAPSTASGCADQLYDENGQPCPGTIPNAPAPVPVVMPGAACSLVPGWPGCGNGPASSYRTPPGGAGGHVGPSCSGACADALQKAAQEAARQAYWARVVEERANTPAPRPTPSTSIWDATKALWDEANDPNNGLHLGVVGLDDYEIDPFEPKDMAQVYDPPADQHLYEGAGCTVSQTWTPNQNGTTFNRNTVFGGCGAEAGDPHGPDGVFGASRLPQDVKISADYPIPPNAVVTVVEIP